MLAGFIAAQPRPAAAAVEGSFQRSLRVSGTADIDITTGSGSIVIAIDGKPSVNATVQDLKQIWDSALVKAVREE